VLQVCYGGRVPSSTSSFRIPDELKGRLEQAAERLKKGKNWIINRALEEYLERHSVEAFRAEARRQSLAASTHTRKDEEFWEKMAAETWNE
jgi:predicted transcriptional regulator